MPIKKILVIIYIIVAGSQIARAQADMKFIKKINSDSEIKGIYDSLRTTLFILNNSVYAMNPSCISETFAGFKPDVLKNTGNAPAAVNAKDIRQSGSGSNSVDDKNKRESGSGSNFVDNKNKRESGSGSNADNDKNKRESGGGSNSKVDDAKAIRQSGSGSLTYSCESDGAKITLHVREIKSADRVRIFYNNAFIDSKYIKIEGL